jgi:hypothetical protein
MMLTIAKIVISMTTNINDDDNKNDHNDGEE